MASAIASRDGAAATIQARRHVATITAAATSDSQWPSPPDSVLNSHKDAKDLIRQIVPYTLRHTFAYELSERDVPVDQIAGYLGHTSSHRITAMYARKATSSLAIATRAVDSYLIEIKRRLRHHDTMSIDSDTLRLDCVPVQEVGLS